MINYTYRLQKATNEYKSLVLRFRHNGDRHKTIPFIKLTKEELVKGKLITDREDVKELFKKVDDVISNYFKTHSIIDEDELMDLINVHKVTVVSKPKVSNLYLIFLKQYEQIKKDSKHLSEMAIYQYGLAIHKFEVFCKENRYYTLNDFNYKLFNKFEKHLRDKKQYKISTINTTITCLKAMLNDYLLETNNVAKLAHLSGFKSTLRKYDKVVLKPYLTLLEVEKIYSTDFSKYKPVDIKERNLINRVKGLNTLRDWIAISFCIAQRYSTLSALNESNIDTDAIVDLPQPKTKDILSKVNLYGMVEDYFNFNKEFPYMPDLNDFNDGIRLVCKIMGYDTQMEGYVRKKVKIGQNWEMRDVLDIYPRYELIASHTLRRSYITRQHQMNRPAELGMAVTNHKSHRMYASYNQRTQEEKADDLVKIQKLEDAYIRR